MNSAGGGVPVANLSSLRQALSLPTVAEVLRTAFLEMAVPSINFTRLTHLKALAGGLVLTSLLVTWSCSPSEEPDADCIPECGQQICGREPVCASLCGTCPEEQACSADGMRCLAPPPIGASCKNDEQCGGGRICLLEAEGAPGGYCTTLCSDEKPCEGSALCQKHHRGEMLCHASCSASNDGCRDDEGYACVDNSFCSSCVSSCTSSGGKELCGDDGCGGWCGACPSDARYSTCSSGVCLSLFDLLDETLPAPRSEMSAASFNDLIYLVGGQENRALVSGNSVAESISEALVFNPKTEAFDSRSVPVLPLALSSPHLISARPAGAERERLYLLGGVERSFFEDEDPISGDKMIKTIESPSRRLFALESGADQQVAWVEKLALPQGQGSIGSAAVPLNGVLYAFVGETPQGVSSNAYRLTLPPDPIDNWKEIKPRPTKRSGMAAASDGRFLWLFGGTGEAGATLDLIERYDPASDEWSKLDPLPYAISNASAVTVDDDRILLFGGSGSNFVPLIVFDTRTEKAFELGASFDGIRNQAAARVGSEVFLFGGVTFGPIDSVVRFTIPAR